MVLNQARVFTEQHRSATAGGQRLGPGMKITALGLPTGEENNRGLHALQCCQGRPDIGALGIIDEIVTEVKGGAHKDVEEQAQYINDVLKASLKELIPMKKDELIQHRYEKFKAMGEYSVLNDLIGVKS